MPYLVFDPNASIAWTQLSNTWIGNNPTAATGLGVAGVTTGGVSFSNQSPAGILATEVTSLAAVNGTGKYFVNYDTGIVYWYSALTGTNSFKATYEYLSATSWKGWGINANQSSGSLTTQYCTFQYLGDSTGAAAGYSVICPGSKTGTGSTILSITNCTFSNCYQLLCLVGCIGTAGNPIQINNNVFGHARPGYNTFTVLGFYQPASTYFQLNNNTFNQGSGCVVTCNTYGVLVAFTNMAINNNTGTCYGLFSSQYAHEFTWANSTIQGNVLSSTPLAGNFIQNPEGTSGNPFVISGNFIGHTGLSILAASSYCTIDSNIFHHFYTGGMFVGTRGSKYNNVVVTNNLFYGGFGSLTSNLYSTGTPTVNIGQNFNAWLDVFQVINNTFLDNPQGVAVNGLFDPGSCYPITKCEFANNIILNDNAVVGGVGFKRYANSSTNFSPITCLDLDYNLLYNDGTNYSGFLGTTANGTFMISGNKYNYASNNVTGVSLSQPTYGTAQGTGRSLVFTFTSATSQTLAWGGGTAVQIVFDSGTVTGASSNDSTNGLYGENYGVLNDTSKSWSTTLANANCPAGTWLKMTSGTYSGNVYMVVSNTATSLYVAPAFAQTAGGGPTTGDTFTLYNAEVTLYDSGATYSVNAGIDPRGPLPTSTKTDSGITITMNDVTSNPSLVNANCDASTASATAHNATFGASSPAVNAGTSTDAPSHDYFGTSRPAGTAFCIGFFEYTTASVGTGAATWAAMTAAGGGTVTDVGTGAATWSNFTSAGVGTFTATSTGAATWSPLTAAGAGSFLATGTGAATWSALVGAGLGTGAAPPGSTGTGAATWLGLVGAGLGSFAVVGAGAATWSALAAAGIGTGLGVSGTQGTGVANLGALTALGIGVSGAFGTGAASWSALTASGLGTIGAVGTGAATWSSLIAAGLATGGGLVEALFLPYQFSTTLMPAALDTTDAFGIDPSQTVPLSAAEDASDPFGIDPGQTTLIITGLDTGP